MLHIKDLFHYRTLTGEFIHKTNTTHKRVGDRAGFIHGHSGYRHICVNGKEMKEHRAAFLYMTGSIPIEVDHINRNKQDNRWSNLRPATRSLNCSNQKIRKDNKTKIKGLSYRPKLHSPWIYRKQINGVSTCRSFKTKQEAIEHIEREYNNGF